jgi:hypothetical protein
VWEAASWQGENLKMWNKGRWQCVNGMPFKSGWVGREAAAILTCDYNFPDRRTALQEPSTQSEKTIGIKEDEATNLKTVFTYRKLDRSIQLDRL